MITQAREHFSHEMNTIFIKYPGLFFLGHRNIRCSHPASWNELTPSQLVAVSRLAENTISEDDLLVEMLGIPHNIVRRIPPEHRYEIGKLLEFIGDEEADLQRFIIKNIGRLKAPADRLKDITFAEFIHIDTFFIDYNETFSNTDLQKLVACLYRPHAKGKRIEFTGDIDISAVAGKHLQVLKAVEINYSLVRRWITRAYPEVFPKNKGNAGNKSRGGWLAVFDSLVGDDIINEDNYAKMPVHEALRYMNRKIIESRKQKHKRA